METINKAKVTIKPDGDEEYEDANDVKLSVIGEVPTPQHALKHNIQ